MKVLEKLLSHCRQKSPWLFHMNSGSCNGCDIELVASIAPRYDVEQLGIHLEGSPRHADILCITGPVTYNTLEGGGCAWLLRGVMQCIRRQPDGSGSVASSHTGGCVCTGVSATARCDYRGHCEGG
jgi:hypothetical protein